MKSRHFCARRDRFSTGEKLVDGSLAVDETPVLLLPPPRSVVNESADPCCPSKRVGKENTYRYAFAADAVHDAERRAQIRIPPLLQLVDLLAKVAI